MHTSRSTIARIEACGNAQHHSPSVGTLRRYAKALGYKLKIELEPVSTN
jgi:transcriptional regulator with XRE-family HTH domain